MTAEEYQHIEHLLRQRGPLGAVVKIDSGILRKPEGLKTHHGQAANIHSSATIARNSPA
jgi:hypothetical protein